jgi:hypothetical protein
MSSKLTDATADALLELTRRPPMVIGGESELAAVLGEALDRYALARLYCVATTRAAILTGEHRSGPDWYRYCPWCRDELEDPSKGGFALHLETVHRAMVEA